MASSNASTSPQVGGPAIDQINVQTGLVRRFLATTTRELFDEQKKDLRSIVSGTKHATIEHVTLKVDSVKDQLQTYQNGVEKELRMVQTQQQAILDKLEGMQKQINALSVPPKKNDMLDGLRRVERQMDEFVRQTSESRIKQSGAKVEQDDKLDRLIRLQEGVGEALTGLNPLPVLVASLAQRQDDQFKLISDRLSTFEDQVNDLSLRQHLMTSNEAVMPDQGNEADDESLPEAENGTPDGGPPSAWDNDAHEVDQSSLLFGASPPSLDSSNSSVDSAGHWPCLTTPSSANVPVPGEQTKSSFSASQRSPSDYVDRHAATLQTPAQSKTSAERPTLTVNISVPGSSSQPRGTKRKRTRTKSKTSEETVAKKPKPSAPKPSEPVPFDAAVVKREPSPDASNVGSTATTSKSRKRGRREDRTTSLERDQEGWPAVLPSASDRSEEMVECGSCDRWYHMTCVGVRKGDVKEDDVWVCMSCAAAEKGRRVSVREENHNGRCPRPGCNKEEGFIMEAILGRRMTVIDAAATYDYLVKWEGYNEERADWKPDSEEAFSTPTVHGLIEAFLAKAEEELCCPVSDRALIMLERATDNGWDSDTGKLAVHIGSHVVAAATGATTKTAVTQWSI